MLGIEEKAVASMVSGIFPGGLESDFRGPIRRDSDVRVHILVVGADAWARAWIKMAALVCHFPNYQRKETLRTRLTWIGLTQDEVDGTRFFGSTDEAETRYRKMMDMAKYLNYFYAASYAMKRIPVELPRDEVDKAWDEVTDSRVRLSNMFNVMTMASKMRTLGHRRDGCKVFYALTPPK